ncbi:uncharacterized protein LOC106874577 [Octopus bimaculoides]|uniref:uncharacterized protein LOC106874577 n=1 Tax=Octopus bimaculoides TaxID=37653 RepID=UPI00071C4878|nr:uncharacterized protein LOC106874577 [Octopus bimaculoides]|eukprot:XP_014777841.1 PREDICTED: uncharacterized protein LOC106874577 [Octopus bimaculoides]
MNDKRKDSADTGQKKEEEISNYRPVVCLPSNWMLLNGLIADEVNNFLERENLLPEEQKEFRKKSKETVNLLHINSKILNEVHIRKEDVALGRIDYRKAYNSVTHCWISEYLKTFRVNEKINSNRSVGIELICANESPRNVKSRRSIFL